MHNFHFLEKELGLFSLPYFAYDFSRKVFHMLYSINCPNFIGWLPLLLEILGDMGIGIVSYLFCDAINFEIYFSVIIRPFVFMTKNSEQKLKQLKNKNSF